MTNKSHQTKIIWEKKPTWLQVKHTKIINYKPISTNGVEGHDNLVIVVSGSQRNNSCTLFGGAIIISCAYLHLHVVRSGC